MNDTKQSFCDWYNEQWYVEGDIHSYKLIPEEIENLIDEGDEYIRGAWQVWLEFKGE